uniref:Uncharacterized protein n=1 Tax=Spermophilus dauricus TaxID=99837 RepID=A0A8C9PCE4_SPEDA
MKPWNRACCVGLFLTTLSLVCIVANAFLLVPDGKTWSSDQLSLHVLLLPGFIGGGLMVRSLEHRPVSRGVGTTIRGSGCEGRGEGKGQSSRGDVFGMLGAIYCLSVSGVGLRIGPKCSINGEWDYHFQETAGAYLKNDDQGLNPLFSSLFFLLVVASCLEMVLCGLHLVTPLLRAHLECRF